MVAKLEYGILKQFYAGLKLNNLSKNYHKIILFTDYCK